MEKAMIRTGILGAAFALLMTGAAFAQDNSPANASADAAPPPVAGQPSPGDATPSADSSPQGDRGDMGPGHMDQGEQDAGDHGTTRSTPMQGGSGSDSEHGWVWQHGDDAGRGAQNSGPGERDHGRGGRGWRHGPAGFHHGMAPPRGAFFRLSRGDGGPSITIKCADSDSTQECVDAIQPLLERAMRNR